MAHVVFITSGITSIRNANLELARRLAAAGHRVTYASHDDIREVVSAHELAYVQLPAKGNDPAATAQPARGLSTKLREALFALPHKLATIRQRQQAAVDSLGLSGFHDLLRTLAPDLLLIDIELNEDVIAAVPSGVPVALTSTWVSLNERPGLPPLHRYLVPGSGWGRGRWGIAWAWWQYRAWKWFHFRMQALRTVGASPTAILQRLAEQVGFPFHAEVDRYQWLLPFSYRTLPVLCLNLREFDLPHAPQPNYHYVGTMVNPQRPEPTATSVDDSLEALLTAPPTPDRKLIYCAFGAYYKGDDTDFFRRVIEAVRDHTSWDVVIGLGGRIRAEALGPLPAHVRVYGWVPQLRLLPRADAALIHAGISTINECLYVGLPMLVYPFKKTTDQMGNAARITYHGLGIVGDRESDTPAMIHDKLVRLMTEDAFRQRTAQMRDLSYAYQQQRRAETVIAQLLRTP